MDIGCVCLTRKMLWFSWPTVVARYFWISLGETQFPLVLLLYFAANFGSFLQSVA